MTHTPKQTDVQGRGVVLRPEPGTVAHDWDTGVMGSCLPGPRTCFASVFAKLGGRTGGQLFPKLCTIHPEGDHAEGWQGG